MVTVKHFKITRINCYLYLSMDICMPKFITYHIFDWRGFEKSIHIDRIFIHCVTKVCWQVLHLSLVWLEILHEPCPVDTIGASSNMIALAVVGFQITRTRMGNCIKYNTFQIFQESFCWCCILLVTLIFWICQLSSLTCLLKHAFDH